MLGRPNLFTSYEAETAMLPTWTQRVAIGVLLVLAVLLPFGNIPFLGFLGEDSSWLRLINQAVIFGIAALGLNLLTGVAGQVSLGHAFFMGVGAYTAAVLGGESSATEWGLGLPIWIWLPASALVAALAGIIVAPTAVRVRGLYLGIVTIGLVFIGIHLSRVLPQISGPAEIGREFPPLEFSLWRGMEPIISFEGRQTWFGLELPRGAATYFFVLVVLVLATLAHKNLVRSRTGRAFAAIRDRDVAAEVMGVPEAKYKTIAFALSSAFAGLSGALFASFVGLLPPESWDLILSIEFVAIILIGGAGTTSGTLLGTFFVVLLPRVVEDGARWMGERAEGEGALSWLWDGIVSTEVGDFGIVSTLQNAPGFPLPTTALETVLYGLLIVLFLLFEPLGLFGIWIKIKNYFKTWPFTY